VSFVCVVGVVFSVERVVPPAKDILLYYKNSNNETNGIGSKGQSFVEKLTAMGTIIKSVGIHRKQQNITCKTPGYRGLIYDFVSTTYKGSFLSPREWTAFQSLYKWLVKTKTLNRFTTWCNLHCAYNKGEFDHKSVVFAGSALISLLGAAVSETVVRELGKLNYVHSTTCT
jgi:hypothetical protein